MTYALSEAGHCRKWADVDLSRHLARLAAHIDLRWIACPAHRKGFEMSRAGLGANAHATRIVQSPEAAWDPAAKGSIYVSAHTAARETGNRETCEMAFAFMVPGTGRGAHLRADAELKARFMNEILTRLEAGGEWACLVDSVPLDAPEAFATTLSDILGFRMPMMVDFREALALVLARE